MKRIFIAINLPGNIKKELVGYQKRWERLPVRWTPPQNLHITLVFIGRVNQSSLESILQTTKQAVSKTPPFIVTLKQIILGPPRAKPRMFWVRAQRDQNILGLQKRLVQELVKKANTGLKRPERRKYLPHITLGRIKMRQWHALRNPPRPKVNLDLSFKVESVEVMESVLKPTGAEYEVVKSFPLCA